MAEDIPVTGPGGMPPRPGYEAAWPRFGPGFEANAPVARRVSWGAIFAGVVVALVVELLLGTLGLAMLMGTIDPATESDTLRGLGAGTGVWFALTALVGLFFGGWTAGRLAGQPLRFDGAMHGIVTWGLCTLVTTWLATNLAGTVLSGALGLVGATLGGVGEGVGAVVAAPAAAPSEPVGRERPADDAVRSEVERFLRETGDPRLSPDALRQRTEDAAARAPGASPDAPGEAERPPTSAMEAVGGALARLAVQGGAAVYEADRRAAIEVLVARTELTGAQAARLVDDWTAAWSAARSRMPDATERVGEAAARVTEDVTDAAGTFLVWAFFAMLLGVVAAALGGGLGAPRPAPAALVPVSSAEH